jgi:hypothetical protein
MSQYHGTGGLAIGTLMTRWARCGLSFDWIRTGGDGPEEGRGSEEMALRSATGSAPRSGPSSSPTFQHGTAEEIARRTGKVIRIRRPPHGDRCVGSYREEQNASPGSTVR